METVMLIAMGVVGAIRVCSYYSESLATDIAKILPFSLMALTIIDNSVIRVVDSTEGVRGAVLQWETIVYYLVAVVVLEFALRIATGTSALPGQTIGPQARGSRRPSPKQSRA